MAPRVRVSKEDIVRAAVELLRVGGEDMLNARSIAAKLSLISEYSLFGAGYWNLMRPFPQNWAVLSEMFDID